ncbi:hypothetical protein [Bradyrhizobium sp. USDA 4451]
MAHADPFLSVLRELLTAAGKMIARTGEIPERRENQRYTAMSVGEIPTFSEMLQLNSADRREA